MMRITEYTYKVYQTMKGQDWIKAGDVAKTLGVPRQNINYSIKLMAKAGLVEVNEAVQPMLFRIVETGSPEVEELKRRIELTKEVYEGKS